MTDRVTSLAELLAMRKPICLLSYQATDQGLAPITRVGGAPTWPAGIPRPRCAAGHSPSFIMQIHLADLPGLAHAPGLLSFHYCLECCNEVTPSFGYDPECEDENPTGYDIRVLPDPAGWQPDGKGALGVVVSPKAVWFSHVEEVPSPGDIERMIVVEDRIQADELAELSCNAEGFMQRGLPDCTNRYKEKLGGWPSWVQNVSWPDCPHGRPYAFAAQISQGTSDGSPWAGPGFAYLWMCVPACPERCAQMSMQFT